MSTITDPADEAFYETLTWEQKEAIMTRQDELFDGGEGDGHDYQQAACWTMALGEMRDLLSRRRRVGSRSRDGDGSPLAVLAEQPPPSSDEDDDYYGV